MTTTQTTTPPVRHGLSRLQAILVVIGIVAVFAGTYAALAYAVQRPNLKGTVVLVDTSTGTTRPLPNSEIKFVTTKYGVVAKIHATSTGSYSARLEVGSYLLKVSDCPFQKHAFVTVSLGLVTTRPIVCYTTHQ